MGSSNTQRLKSRGVACFAVLVAVSVALVASAHAEPPPTPTTISLSANATSVTVPAEIELETTTDESLTNTGYSVYIVNLDAPAGTHMAACGTGTFCGASYWVTWAENHDPQPHRFRAELRHNGSVVSADEVTVEVVPAHWSVTLEAPGAVTVGEEIRLNAVANRAFSGTGYTIRIIDQDENRTMGNGGCSGERCWASEWTTWAENPNPLPHHYRAEIRHSATDTVVASNEVVVDVLPRTFNVSLSFSVVNGVNKATATATPSTTGTGYSVRIRRLDGTQVCNLWLSNPSRCQGSVFAGQTYRATVEHSTGHVAGRTSWWTFTANGPVEEKADDLDLIALAALYASPSAVCAHVLLYPGTHLGGSSVSDQYLACEAAVQEGKSILGVLRAIAAAGGGTAVLWYLHERVTEETITHDPSDDEEVDEPTPVPPPVTWPADIEDDVDQLMAQNPQLTDPTTARTVIKTCRRLVLKAGFSPQDCLDLPIFASGDLDVPEPTQHDRESIAVRPQWVRLNYADPAGRGRRDWYDGRAQCPNPRPEGMHCHEYPFFATKQGGGTASPVPRLKLVAAGQNAAQGGLLGRFLITCLGREENAPFLSLPMPKGSGIPTLRLCN